MRLRSLATLASLALLGAPASVPAAPPDVPARIHYQGVLLDGGGAPRTGFVDLSVRIFDALTGGTLLYKQEFPGTALADGTFTLAIGPSGAASDLPTDPLTTDLATVFAGDLLAAPDRFLELSVDLDPALVRIQILTAPFALRAGSALHAESADVALDTGAVNGAPPELVSEIWEHLNFDGGPPNQDPREGLGDVDGDGMLNFIDADNDDDGLSDTAEVAQGTDINLVTPTLSAVDPATAAFAFPTTVSVSGTNFEAGMSVSFGSQSPTPTNVTATSFDVVVGPQDLGPVTVQVTRLNGESDSAAGLFSFVNPLPPVAHGPHAVIQPRLSTFAVRATRQTLIGRSQKGYSVDTSPGGGDAIPDLTGVPATYSAYADYAFDASGRVVGVGCRKAATPTCDVRLVRDADGDDAVDPEDPAELTDVESFSGTISATLRSASLSLDAGDEPVLAYARGVFSPGLVVDVVVARDRNGDGDYADANEIVPVEGGLADTMLDVASDAAGNPALLYLRNPAAPAGLVLGHDRSGDGDFDDSPGGNPELQTLVAGGVDCFQVAFDASDRLGVIYQETGAGGAMLLQDLDGDGDFGDPGETTALPGTGVTGCGIVATPLGGFAVATNADGDVTVLTDRNADGDFADPLETVPLGATATEVGVAASAESVFVATDTEVYENPIVP